MAEKESLVKKIFVGVLTAVLTAVVLSYIPLTNENGAGPKEAPKATSSETAKLLARQAELERRIKALSSEERQNKSANLEREAKKFVQAVGQEGRQRSRTPQIAGLWRDLNTGASYRFTQQGTAFSIEEISLGTVSASGTGTFKGKTGIRKTFVLKIVARIETNIPFGRKLYVSGEH